MFKPRDIVTAVEIGTSKTCVLIGTTDEQGNLLVLAHGERPSAGAVVKGEIANMETIVPIVDATLQDAEAAAEVEIDQRHVYVAVTGSHIVPYRGFGSVPIQGEDRKITREHMDEALRNASLISLTPDQIAVNYVEGDYLLDDSRRLQNPLNQTAHKLQAHAHIICGNRNRIENFGSPLKETGIEQVSYVFSALANAHSMLSEEAQKRGALLIDMGAGTTEFILFHSSGVYDSGVLAVGCEHLANDLALALDLNVNQTRKFLVDNPHGQRKQGGHTFIEITGNITRREIPIDSVDKVIDLRLRETFGLIRQRLVARNQLVNVGGVFITGGAALLPTIKPALYAVFEAPVNLVGENLPGDITGAVTDLKTPRHNMVIGLLRYGLKQGNPQRSILPDLDRGLNQAIKRSWRAIVEGIKF
jgi:cell division protein FtsA